MKAVKAEYELQLSMKDERIKSKDELLVDLVKIIAEQKQEIAREKDETEQHVHVTHELTPSFRMLQHSPGYWLTRFPSHSQVSEGLRSLLMSQCSSGYWLKITSPSLDQVSEGLRPLPRFSVSSIPRVKVKHHVSFM